MNYSYIMNLVGRDSFFKGRMYPSIYIRQSKVDKLWNCYRHVYKVKSERTNKWYNVTIRNNGGEVLDFSCSCP